MLAKTSAPLRLISSLLCAVVVAGCGGRVAAKPSTLEAVTVRFAVRQSAANYSALADKFHRQHPNVTIQIISNMQGTALKTLTALGVDAFRDTVAVRPDPQLKDALLPLDEWINADKNFPRADILSGALAATRNGGAQYGIPAGLSPIVAYYDAARFKAVQANPPGADWTVSDFLQAAVSANRQQAKVVDDADFAYGFCSVPVSSDPIIFTYLLGGQLVDPQNPTVPMLDSAINQRALEWYAALRTQYAVTPNPDEFAAAFSTRGVTEASMRSKCGLWLGSYASQGNRPAAMRWQGKPVMLPLPRGQATLAVASMDAYYILRQSTHRNETWQWLAFLLNHQEAAGAQIPVRRSLIESVGFASRVPADALRVARNLPDDVLVLGSSTQQNEQSIYTIYLEAVDLVVRDKAGAHAALVAAQRKAMDLFSP